ncbi:zinc finger, PHD-type containing protein [Tanacetum coccineum]|uniref:Zinc finger, PHD-type containing protein n=1 Tax=Tanacetum coccineum TaxID=301880 RepID=A0ABQ5F735_9ASTR
MSDMTACLNDLSYIPMNNEQNKSTQGDIEFFQFVFPLSKGYKLPPSYYAIKKTFKTIGLGYESIHACVNDCFLFRGEDNKDKQLCSVCNTSRRKDNNTTGKKVPKKVLGYFPIIPRLQRLYKSSHTVKEMTWHATGKCTEPGKIQHPVNGRAWKKFDTPYLKFTTEPRNVRLGLAADGFNPFGNLKSYLMLMLLILGPKSPGKDIDVYLRPLIDDLKDLWALKGVETIDVATGQKFNMRAMVLWTINVFPARRSLSGWSGQGYMACPTCNEDIPSMRETEDEDPPREFNRAQIMTQLSRLPTLEKGKHSSYGGVKIKHNVLVELNYTTKARQDLKILGIRSELWLSQNKSRKCSKPQAKYSFTPENRKKFCQLIKGVKIPDGFRSNFKHKVTANDSNITGLKSHDYHIMMQCLLPYGLQQYLPSSVATPIIELCSFFKQICSRTLMEDDMVKAQSKVIDILCNLKLIYPPAFFDIMIYLVIHLPPEALEGGPVPPVILLDHQELKKVIWYALHNTPEINMYRAKFKSEFPNQDMKEEFPGCRDERRTTQNSGICSPSEKDGEMYYGQLEEILEFSYMSFKVVLFRVKLFDTRNEGRKIKRFVIRNNITQIWSHEDDHDVIHFDNSFVLALSTSLDDLDFATLNIDGQSMDVDAPTDIIDVDKDDDLIDDEDALPYDLANSDDEDLTNDDDDDVVVYSSEEED